MESIGGSGISGSSILNIMTGTISMVKMLVKQMLVHLMEIILTLIGQEMVEMEFQEELTQVY